MKNSSFVKKLTLAFEQTESSERDRQFVALKEHLLKEARLNKEQQERLDLFAGLIREKKNEL